MSKRSLKVKAMCDERLVNMESGCDEKLCNIVFSVDNIELLIVEFQICISICIDLYL